MIVIMYLLGLVAIVYGTVELVKLMKIKIDEGDTKIFFVAPAYVYIFISIGIVLCVSNFVCFGCYDDKALLFISMACFFGMLREINHCYVAISPKNILINGRKFTKEVAKEYGRTKKMRLLSFVTIYVIQTEQDRGYVYLDKKIGLHKIIMKR